MLRTRAAAALLATLAVAACKKEAGQQPQGSGLVGADATGPIVIGEVGSMTGNDATFGISSDRGIQLAIEEANAAGGIKGRKMVIKAYDDEGKPEQAATATTKLIASDHATAILGEVASTRSMFMADKAQAAKVPMVSPSSTNPAVTEKGDYIFRACFIDPFQGYVMAKFAREGLKLGKVAILRDVRNNYSVGLADVFAGEFKKAGGSIIADESFSAGDVDFRAQLTKIKQTNPEALYVPAYYTEVGLIAQQSRQLGLNVPLLGGDGWDSEKLYEIGKDAIAGSYFSNHYSVDDPSPRIRSFVERYTKRWGGAPDGLAAQAYDAAGMLVDAMKRAKDLSGPSIRDALAGTKDYPGVTGNITLDDKRNPTKPAVVLKVGKGPGKYEYVTTIQPEGVKKADATPPPTTAPAGAPAATK